MLRSLALNFLCVRPQAWLAQPDTLELRGFLEPSQINEDAEYVEASRILTIGRTGEECVAAAALPNVRFSMARTGQIVRTVADDGTVRSKLIWAVDLPLREYPD